MENKPSVSKILLAMLNQVFKFFVIIALLTLLPYYTGILLSIWYPLNPEQIEVSILSLFTLESTIDNSIVTTLYRYGVLVDAVIALLITAFILWYKQTRVTLSHKQLVKDFKQVIKKQLIVDKLKEKYNLTLDTNDYMSATCIVLYEDDKLVKKFWDVIYEKEVLITKECSVNDYILINYKIKE